jgi:hypothetical protein
MHCRPSTVPYFSKLFDSDRMYTCYQLFSSKAVITPSIPYNAEDKDTKSIDLHITGCGCEKYYLSLTFGLNDEDRNLVHYIRSNFVAYMSPRIVRTVKNWIVRRYSHGDNMGETSNACTIFGNVS